MLALAGMVIDKASKRNSPSKVVEEVVEEDHRNDSLAESKVLWILDRGGSQRDPNGKGTTHATCCRKKQRPATESVNHAGPEPGFEHVAHEDEAIQHVLVVRGVDADVVEDVVQIVS